jgi:serine/threonine protein kinase
LARERFGKEHEARVAVISAMRDAVRIMRDQSLDDSLADALERFVQVERRQYALKLYEPRIDDDPGQTLRRTEEEVRILRESTHPHIIPLVDAASLDDGRSFTVYPYYRRGTLEGERQHLVGDAHATLRAMADVLRGVAYLHRKSVVHRDVKPANVLVDDEGRLVVGDLGLVYDSSRAQSLSRVDEEIGNRQFCPDWGLSDPLSQRDPRFDVYALAKLAWWMASGKNRLRREDHTVEGNNLVRLFPADSGMRLLQEIIGHGLASRPEDVAYRDAAGMLVDVERAITEIATHRHRPRRQPRNCRACQEGFYKREDQGVPTDLQTWANGSRQRGTTGHVVGIQMFRCDKCGHLVWYAEHPESKPTKPT